MELQIVNISQINEIEKKEVEIYTDEILEKIKLNPTEINKLTFESITTLALCNSYNNELGNKKIKNKKRKYIQNEINSNYYKSQYCAQQILQKLAQRDLINFELITTVNNKLNASIIETNEEINNIYKSLRSFFNRTKSDLVNIENRLEKLETNVKLLNWKNSIEYQMYGDREYLELNRVEKIVCMSKDFYEITKGKWSLSDLLLLKSSISEIGMSPSDKITYFEFIKYISEDESLYNKLIDIELKSIENDCLEDLAIISGLKKSTNLESDESYIIDTVVSEIKDYIKEIDESSIKYSIVKNYIKQNNYIDISKEISVFDFIVELLFSIDIINTPISEYEEVQIVEDETNTVIVCEEVEVIEFDKADIKTLISYAEKGNIEAQHYLALAYYYGKDIEKNRTKALEYFLKVAQQGYASAQYFVGYMYDNGEGVVKQYSKAFEWYLKSAEQGYAKAQYEIGCMYYDGVGTSRDKDKAFAWFLKAEEQGDKLATDSINRLFHY